MPRSNFYWETSGGALKRKDGGAREGTTYRTHSTVQQEGGGETAGGDSESTNSLLST